MTMFKRRQRPSSPRRRCRCATATAGIRRFRNCINADDECASRSSCVRISVELGRADLSRAAFEKRRLRISQRAVHLFDAMRNDSRSCQGGRGRELSVTRREIPTCSLVLDSIAAAKQLERERQGYGFTGARRQGRMRLSSLELVVEQRSAGPPWEDETRAPLKRRLREIAAAM